MREWVEKRGETAVVSPLTTGNKANSGVFIKGKSRFKSILSTLTELHWLGAMPAVAECATLRLIHQFGLYTDKIWAVYYVRKGPKKINEPICSLAFKAPK